MARAIGPAHFVAAFLTLGSARADEAATTGELDGQISVVWSGSVNGNRLSDHSGVCLALRPLDPGR